MNMLRSLVCWFCLAAAVPSVGAQVTPVEPPAPDSTRMLLDVIRDDLVGLRFEEALAALEALLGEPDLSTADRGEALVLRSQAHVAFGDLEAAERDYREILRMRPAYVPDSSLTPGKAMERFKRARAVTLGDLIVEVVPTGARILIDGRLVEPTVEGAIPLLAGEHVVEAEHQGFDRLRQSIEIEANREARVELRLVPNSRTVILTTEPEGVEVKLNGVLIGHTVRSGEAVSGEARRSAQLRIEHLPLGEHVFELSKPCFRTQSFRDLLTVDLLDWSTKSYLPVVLSPVHSTVVPIGGPAGADLLIDGRRVGRLPLDSVEVCPGERRIEVTYAGRRIWSAVRTLAEAEEWAEEIRPRPNVVLLGADDWPAELRDFEGSFNGSIQSAPPEDPASVESWKTRRLPADIDLAIARGRGGEDRAPVWMLYSPILDAVAPLDSGAPATGQPSWTGVSWGMFVADSELRGPALLVEVPATRPAHVAGLRPGDRLVALGGTQVTSSAQVRLILDVASANAPLDAEWISPDGTSRRGQLSGRATVKLLGSPALPADGLIRAAWAVVDATCDPERAAAATANLALLLSTFQQRERAVQAWRRAELPERPGIARGTAQYYLGRELQRLGREREAIRALRAAAESDATAFDDGGPRVAPAARDRMADLGVTVR